MRLSVAVFAAILVGLVLVSTSMAQTGSPKTLESLRGTYDNTVAQITTVIRSQREEALRLYGKNLDFILAAFRQKGDIDSYLFIESERKRFQSQMTVPTNTPHVGFAEAVYAYRKQVQDIEAEKERRTADLLRKYIPALNGLIQTLMTENKIEDAQAVGAARKAAEFELAELESRLPALEIKDSRKKDSRKVVPKEARAFGGHHYMVVFKETSWHEAKKQCEDMGGHLVIITSKMENDFVKKLAVGKDFSAPSYCIGCTDEKKEGHWLWVDGTRVTWDAWSKGEPNNVGGVEDYGVLSWRLGGWNDLGASHRDIVGYICEWDN